MALRIRNAPAVIEWSDMSATPRSPMYLAELHPQSVQLSLHFDQQQQAASFKIRVLLGTRKETAGKDGDYLHILVHPSDVILLLPDTTHHLPDGVSGVLRGPTTCLRLVLSKPVSIAAPSDMSLPLQERHSRLLNSLSLLAKQTVLTIHLGQHQISSPEVLQQLCQAYCDGSVKQHPRHNTLQDLYPGRGASIIEDFDRFAGFESKPPGLGSHGPGDVQSTINPPPYAKGQSPAAQPPEAELPGQPPPSLFAQQPSRKRRRASTSIGATAPLDAHNLYTEFLAQQKTQTEAFLLQQAQMGKMLAHWSNQAEQMANQVMRVDKRLNEEMAKTREKEEEAIKSIVQQEVEVAMEECFEREREGLEDNIREACLDELKGVLEGGLFTITFP